MTLLCIGAALVDILSQQPESFITRHDLIKGSMMLTDRDKADRLYQDMKDNAVVVAGGAVANTAAVVSLLGHEVHFCGALGKDTLGEKFIRSIEEAKVNFHPAYCFDEATGTVFVTVTPDTQRTMNAYLGASQEMSADDVDEWLIAQSDIVLMEGYNLEWPDIDDLMDKVFHTARIHKTKVAFNLSDAHLVDRHRAKIDRIVREEVDILFANETEITALLKTQAFEDAVKIVDTIVPFAALTRGADGSIICDHGKTYEIPSMKLGDVIDTTGAGDAYAGGVLYGVLNNFEPQRSGKLGSLCAAEVISHIGARPKRNLQELMAHHKI